MAVIIRYDGHLLPTKSTLVLYNKIQETKWFGYTTKLRRIIAIILLIKVKGNFSVQQPFIHSKNEYSKAGQQRSNFWPLQQLILSNRVLSLWHGIIMKKILLLVMLFIVASSTVSQLTVIRQASCLKALLGNEKYTQILM